LRKKALFAEDPDPFRVPGLGPGRRRRLPLALLLLDVEHKPLERKVVFKRQG
jgi:hypothetical protein